MFTCQQTCEAFTAAKNGHTLRQMASSISSRAVQEKAVFIDG